MISRKRGICEVRSRYVGAKHSQQYTVDVDKDSRKVDD